MADASKDGIWLQAAVFAIQSCAATNVRFSLNDVRFTPQNGHLQRTSPCPLCAKSGHPKLAVALSRISDKYGRARQSDDNFGELAGLRIDVD